MRPIKFRAWDKGTKTMAFVDALYSPVAGTLTRADVYVESQQQQYGREMKDVELMQFTSLLDKNGKEIYEGDIVKWRSHPNPTKQGEIKWGSCGFYIVWFDNDLERERNFPRTKHLGGHLNTIEVIGNIYENPELK